MSKAKLLASTVRPKLLTIPQVSRELNISRTSTYDLIRSGVLPLRKIGARSFVLRSDVDNFIASLPAVNGRAD
jgi:excisionase family DNA binding protein